VIKLILLNQGIRKQIFGLKSDKLICKKDKVYLSS